MRQIGTVLEGTRNVHWPLSAWDNLLYFGHLKGLWGKRVKAQAEKLLRELDLWDKRHHLVRTFSRGMQQKVAIACAYLRDPAVLLLDIVPPNLHAFSANHGRAFRDGHNGIIAGIVTFVPHQKRG